LTVTADFSGGTAGWTADYADYLPGSPPPDFVARYEALPGPLAGSGYRVSGYNVSDDLIMYLYRPVTGLRPNTAYRVEGSVTFASDVAAGGVGVSDAVWIKFGASSVEPARVLVNGVLRTNFDKGEQEPGGRDAANIGLFNVSPPCNCTAQPWTLQTRSTAAAKPAIPVVRSDAEGRLWLVVGTESGFEVPSLVYYTSATFTLTVQ